MFRIYEYSGRRRGELSFWESRHHGTADYGLPGGTTRYRLCAGASRGRGDGYGGWIFPGVGEAFLRQLSRCPGTRKCHGSHIQCQFFRFPCYCHCRATGTWIVGDRADALSRSGGHGPSGGQMGHGGPAARRHPPYLSTGGQSGAHTTDRPGFCVAPGRHPQGNCAHDAGTFHAYRQPVTAFQRHAESPGRPVAGCRKPGDHRLS